MLYRNDVFELDGVRMRFLSDDVQTDMAWCIELDNHLAWPICLPNADLVGISAATHEDVHYRRNSSACLLHGEKAWERLKPLLEKYEQELFEPSSRNRCVLDYAQGYGCSPVTLRKGLRRYWQRGQSKFALIPDYALSGRCGAGDSNEVVDMTAGRGRRSRKGNGNFQVSTTDQQYMRQIIERVFLKDLRVTLVDAYEELVSKHYRFEDGNQKLFVNPPGELPSMRQFRYFLQQHFDIEQRVRSRVGDSDYEREHRKVLGTVMQDCLGVGHYYEIDATIADIYLVSTEDPSKIIGKPTLYFIIDRKSKLVVGFYFGLENASWNAALQAIYSISEDKRELCERYGVEYRPEDWPAHQVFPQEFLADRGDMISHASDNIAEYLHVTVTNVPPKRPDWKPLVENQFRLAHHTLRSVAPAYDPPSNATRRRGKHYEKDACLTIRDFGHLLINAIIKHNRREILNYDLTPAEINCGVRPSPIELWNHGIVSRTGVLTRFPEEKVRLSLLRKETAVVTENGLLFRGCYYSSPEALTNKWFERARQKRFKVTVSYDPRLVDQIYVHSLNGKDAPHLAQLTARSQKYSTLSFDEVHYYEHLRKLIRDESEHSRLQNSVDFRQTVKPVISDAKKRLKKADVKTSRTARRADIKPTRHQELVQERQSTARMQKISEQEHVLPSPSTTAAGVTLQSELLTSVLDRMKA